MPHKPRPKNPNRKLISLQLNSAIIDEFDQERENIHSAIHQNLEGFSLNERAGSPSNILKDFLVQRRQLIDRKEQNIESMKYYVQHTHDTYPELRDSEIPPGVRNKEELRILLSGLERDGESIAEARKQLHRRFRELGYSPTIRF